MLNKNQISNKIINNDCLEILKNIEDSSIDMFFTSPPYAERRGDCYFTTSENEYLDWFIPIAEQIKRTMANQASFFLNIKECTIDGSRSLYVKKLVIELVEKSGFYFIDEFCWTKNPFPTGNFGRFKNAWEPVFHFIKSDISQITFNPTACGHKNNFNHKKKHTNMPKNGSHMGGFDFKRFNKLEKARPSNHIHINNISNQFSKKSEHPATFPIGLPEFFIMSFSNVGDLICDPFAGSGTTALACKNTDRNYLMIEKEQKYYNLIQERLKKDKITNDEIILSKKQYVGFNKLLK